MATSNERQAQFVYHLVTTGCNPTEAAQAAGYAVPKQDAYRLTRLAHVQTAIRQERERLIPIHGTSVALSTLQEIMRDKSAPASARIRASRTMLEAVGLFDKSGRDNVSGKPFQETSARELANIVSRLDQEMAKLSPATLHS